MLSVVVTEKIAKVNIAGVISGRRLEVFPLPAA